MGSIITGSWASFTSVMGLYTGPSRGVHHYCFSYSKKIYTLLCSLGRNKLKMHSLGSLKNVKTFNR